MKKWIVSGLVAAMLMMGGGMYAYWIYKQNRPAPVWVPLPINAELPVSKRDELVKDLKTKITAEEILLKASGDLGLMREWNLSSDEAAVVELRRRVFVREGDAATPMGRVPAIHIGVMGKLKEREFSGKIAMRLMDDVWKILGIQAPPKRE